MTDLRNLLSNFWKADHLKDTDPTTLTVKEVVREEVGREKEVKPVMVFLEDHRKFVLNGTNYNNMTEGTGTPHIEDWIGARIELSYDPRAGGSFGAGIVLQTLEGGTKN